MARAAILLCFTAAAVAAFGQGTKPRDSAKEYPVCAELKTITLCAENFGHGITSEYGNLYARDYLVIEAAFFGKTPSRATKSTGDFVLRLNGNKVSLMPQSAGTVAASIQYDDWEERPRGSVSAGAGDAGVTLGSPAPAGRFPGDPRANRLPAPPRVDTSADRSGIERVEASPGEVVQRSALPEGENAIPVSGFLYFPYKGKMSKVKSLELVYEGPYGAATLRLF